MALQRVLAEIRCEFQPVRKGKQGGVAHHDGGRADLNIAAQDGEGPGMTLDLIADQVRQGVADRSVQLADDDLGLGTQMILRAFDQCLTRPQ
jgi:hypothetical protein